MTAEEKQYNLDNRYLRMARIWAENSYCLRRQVGALVVKDKMIISDGYNGTPSGFDNVCEDNEGVTYPYVCMQKQTLLPNSLAAIIIVMAVRFTWTRLSPCIECAKLIIQAGIKRVVYAEKYRLEDGIDLLTQSWELK